MNRIKELREKAGFSQYKLADLVGTTAATIQRIETGKRPLSEKWARAIADALGLQVAEIFGNILPANPIGIQVIGEVAAGVWKEHEQVDEQKYPPVPIAFDPRYQPETQFALYVRGESMNLTIGNGEFAICVQWREIGRGPRDGDLVVVERRRDGLVESTIKRVMIKAQKLFLMPESSDPKWQTPLELELPGGLENDEIVLVALVIGRYQPLA